MEEPSQPSPHAFAHRPEHGTQPPRAESGDPQALEALNRLAGRPSAFARYRFEGEIARGGMGVVMRVYDQDLQRHLAMKVILGQGDEKASEPTPPLGSRHVARFLEEAQVTSQLDHPGIVPVHEIGLDGSGKVYFTMKLVKGRTLKEVFDEMAAGREEWTHARVLGLILRVCEAMAYAHHKGVVHRDLKPSNVMVGRFGEVYVMDWGLARLIDREDRKDLRLRPAPAGTSTLHSDRRTLVDQSPDSPLLTMDGDVVGTPAYMSPEQAAGRVAEIGPQADVYGVGAMLYQMMAGHMPYVPVGAKLNNYAIWQRVQEGPPVAITHLAPGAPAELVAICEKAMAREVGERYGDMTELARDLRAFVEGRVVAAYEAGAWAEARKWLRRNRMAAGSLATALIFGLVALLAVTWSWRRTGTELDAKRAAIANAETTLQALQEQLAENRRHLAQIKEEIGLLDEAKLRAQVALAEEGTRRADELVNTARESLCSRCEGTGRVAKDCHRCSRGRLATGEPCQACAGGVTRALCVVCRGNGSVLTK